VPTRKQLIKNGSHLNSWKEIAAYLNRGVRTVQRWEQELQLPVHRIGAGKRAPVYATASELKFWVRSSAGKRAIAAVDGGRGQPDPGAPKRERELATRFRQLAKTVAESSIRHRALAETLEKNLLALRAKVQGPRAVSTSLTVPLKPTVLCVDDDEICLSVRKQVLESRGYTVIAVSEPEEGLRIFNSRPVDAVVVDYAMPVMDGKTLSMRLKALKPRIPIVMLTALPRIRSQVALIVDAFLEKGEHPEQLLNTIESLLAVRSNSDGEPQFLEDALDMQPFLASVIDATNAEFGTVQLLDRTVLRIVAHHGFAAEFLKHFDTVSDDNCCCGAAMKRGSRVLVSDVVCDPLFQDAKTQAIMLDSNVRACQSTPFFDQRGKLAGVIATHFQKPTTFTSLDWKQVNRIVANFTQKLVQGRQQPFSFST